MRILNDEEIDNIQLKVMQGYIDVPTQRGYSRAVAKVQYQTDMEDVYEWGNTFCVTNDHYSDVSLSGANTRKRECRKCWESLKQLVEE